MNNGAKAVLTLIAILMYAIGIILLFINIFGGYYSSNNTTVFCGLMIGATIFAGIVKMFGNDNKDDSK